jgi:16S rRNA (guanine(966)-N(2))-methyltransferase RsmD
MRVIAGEFRSRRLKGLPGRSQGQRPTSDRVRESVFNMLGETVQGARFLDLFAGTGAVGIEALSRGARAATFVENSPAAVRVLRENAAMLGLGGRATIIPRDVVSWLKSAEARTGGFDVVYMDPPYASGVQMAVLELLGRGALLVPEAVVLLERKEPLDADRAGVLYREESRKYGKTHIETWRIRPATNGSG